MALRTIRKFTDEDAARIEAAAKRFCERRGIKPEVALDRNFEEAEDYTRAVEYYIHAIHQGSYDDVRAWRKAYARALRECESATLTTGYGYVGHHVD